MLAELFSRAKKIRDEPEPAEAAPAEAPAHDAQDPVAEPVAAAGPESDDVEAPAERTQTFAAVELPGDAEAIQAEAPPPEFAPEPTQAFHRVIRVEPGEELAPEPTQAFHRVIRAEPVEELAPEPTQAFKRVIPVELPPAFEEPEAERTQSFSTVLKPVEESDRDAAGEDTDSFEVTLPIEPAPGASGPSDITATQSFPAVIPLGPFGAEPSGPEEVRQEADPAAPSQPVTWGSAAAGEQAASWVDESEGASWIQSSGVTPLWGEDEADESVYDEETRELEVDPSSWLSGAPGSEWVSAEADSDWIELDPGEPDWLEAGPGSDWVEASGEPGWLSEEGQGEEDLGLPFGGGSAFGTPSSFAASLGAEFEPPED